MSIDHKHSNDNSSDSSDSNDSIYDRNLVKTIEENVKLTFPPPLPAIYNPSTLLYPSMKQMNKIDISSSVAQYLNEGITDEIPFIQTDKHIPTLSSTLPNNKDNNDRNKNNDEDDDDDDAEPVASFVVSKSQATVISRDPRTFKNISSNNEQLSSSSHIDSNIQQQNNKFEFFTRQLPEINCPTSHLLDNVITKSSDKQKTKSNAKENSKEVVEKKRHSIYRCPKNLIKSRKGNFWQR